RLACGALARYRLRCLRCGVRVGREGWGALGLLHLEGRQPLTAALVRGKIKGLWLRRRRWRRLTRRPCGAATAPAAGPRRGSTLPGARRGVDFTVEFLRLSALLALEL